MRVDTKITEVFQFNELSDKAKEVARDWFKNGDEFNSDFILEDAKEAGKILGIDVSKIYFTGFASQGDGACFDGKYKGTEDVLSKIKEYVPTDEKLHDIALLLSLSAPLTATIKQRGYYHSGCMEITCYGGDDEIHGKEVELLEDALKAFADWIYSQLNKEYEWSQSNEHVDEAIIANEYEFTREGKRYE